MTTLSQTTTGPTGTVLYVEVWDSVAGTYTRTGQGATSRALTTTEQAMLAARADQQARLAKLVNAVSPAQIAVLRQWAVDARVTVTSGNAVTVLATVVDRLGKFFTRFADLAEGQRLDQQTGG